MGLIKYCIVNTVESNNFSIHEYNSRSFSITYVSRRPLKLMWLFQKAIYKYQLFLSIYVTFRLIHQDIITDGIKHL